MGRCCGGTALCQLNWNWFSLTVTTGHPELDENCTNYVSVPSIGSPVLCSFFLPKAEKCGCGTAACAPRCSQEFKQWLAIGFFPICPEKLRFTQNFIHKFLEETTANRQATFSCRGTGFKQKLIFLACGLFKKGIWEKGWQVSTMTTSQYPLYLTTLKRQEILNLNHLSCMSYYPFQNAVFSTPKSSTPSLHFATVDHRNCLKIQRPPIVKCKYIDSWPIMCLTEQVFSKFSNLAKKTTMNLARKL
jgi:hypothetical protein